MGKKSNIGYMPKLKVYQIKRKLPCNALFGVPLFSGLKRLHGKEKR